MAWKFVFLVAVLMTSSLAQAVCYRDGKPYQTGAEVGGFICQTDGTWRRKLERGGPESLTAVHFAAGRSDAAFDASDSVLAIRFEPFRNSALQELAP